MKIIQILQPHGQSVFIKDQLKTQPDLNGI